MQTTHSSRLWGCQTPPVPSWVGAIHVHERKKMNVFIDEIIYSMSNAKFAKNGVHWFWATWTPFTFVLTEKKKKKWCSCTNFCFFTFTFPEIIEKMNSKINDISFQSQWRPFIFFLIWMKWTWMTMNRTNPVPSHFAPSKPHLKPNLSPFVTLGIWVSGSINLIRY